MTVVLRRKVATETVAAAFFLIGAFKIIEISSSLAATAWAGVVVPDILHVFLMRSLDFRGTT